MATIARAYLYLLNALRAGAAVVITLVFVLIVTDVFVRTLGFSPNAYTIALVEYGLLWFTMLGAPWIARQKGHVFIDALTRALPPRVHWYVAKLAYIVCIVSSSLFFYFSLKLLVDTIGSGELDDRGVDMHLWLLYLPMPICFALLIVEFFRYLLGFDDMYGIGIETRESV